MLFNTYGFLLVFLPAALLIYWFADKSPRWRTWVLVALSCVFYSYWDVRFLPLMIGSILFNWWMANVYVATKNYLLIRTAIVANLLVLAFFKYTNFLADTFTTLLGAQIAHLSLALPLGISFFTFHHIMYLVDLGRGKAPTYPLDRYALYICFFPQAIAGPIARWNEVIHQFGQRVFAPGWERRCALGTIFIIIGLAQKTLLADPIGKAIDPIYAQALTEAVTPGRAWLAPAFAFQVFFDFSAYSDIAIGLALIFGVKLPVNFDEPFRTTTILEFWQRWHMTLGRFLRDYVFTPLSNMRIGGRALRTTRLLMALLLTMAICGLWHGAGWTYVLWGTLQGVAMVIAAIWRRYGPPLPAVIGWALTIGFFVGTIVFFRAGSLEAALRIYEGLAYFPTYGSAQNRDAVILGAIAAVALPATHKLVEPLAKVPRPVTAVGLAVLAIMAMAAIAGQSNFEFVYFQF
jgi:D-alanyl-lipoteichoic acid acyltransferase DltB (MBOAT superfamily)